MKGSLQRDKPEHVIWKFHYRYAVPKQTGKLFQTVIYLKNTPWSRSIRFDWTIRPINDFIEISVGMVSIVHLEFAFNFAYRQHAHRKVRAPLDLYLSKISVLKMFPSRTEVPFLVNDDTLFVHDILKANIPYFRVSYLISFPENFRKEENCILPWLIHSGPYTFLLFSVPGGFSFYTKHSISHNLFHRCL